VFKDESKHKLLGIVDDIAPAGVEGIVLGCTELYLVIKQADLALPRGDTLSLYAQMAVDFLTADD
jgi:aspartate racemase